MDWIGWGWRKHGCLTLKGALQVGDPAAGQVKRTSETVNQPVSQIKHQRQVKPEILVYRHKQILTLFSIRCLSKQRHNLGTTQREGEGASESFRVSFCSSSAPFQFPNSSSCYVVGNLVIIADEVVRRCACLRLNTPSIKLKVDWNFYEKWTCAEWGWRRRLEMQITNAVMIGVHISLPCFRNNYHQHQYRFQLVFHVTRIAETLESTVLPRPLGFDAQKLSVC